MPIVPYKGKPSRLVPGLPRLNHLSWQANGLVLWVPGTALHRQDFATERAVTLDAALTLGAAHGHGAVWQNTDSSAMAIIDGSADGAMDFGLADPFTISFWTDVPSGGNGTFMAKAGITNANHQFQIFVATSGGAHVGHRVHGSDDFNWGDVVSGQGPKLITLTKSGAEAANDVQGYVDGQFLFQDTAGTSTLNEADVMIGARRADDINGGEGFQLDAGDQVWDARIYNRALTPAEVWALYDPATRWDLYDQEPIIVGSQAAAAAGVDPTCIRTAVLQSGFLPVTVARGTDTGAFRQQAGWGYCNLPVDAGAVAEEIVGHGRLLSRERNRLVQVIR